MAPKRKSKLMLCALAHTGCHIALPHTHPHTHTHTHTHTKSADMLYTTYAQIRDGLNKFIKGGPFYSGKKGKREGVRGRRKGTYV